MHVASAIVRVAILPVLVAGMVAGCASRNCTGDPRTDSLGCASQGVSSGLYDSQTARMVVDLHQVRLQAETERRRGNSLRVTLANVAARRKILSRELAVILSQVVALEESTNRSDLRLARLRHAVMNSIERVETHAKEPSIIEEEERGLEEFYSQWNELKGKNV